MNCPSIAPTIRPRCVMIRATIASASARASRRVSGSRGSAGFPPPPPPLAAPRGPPPPTRRPPGARARGRRKPPPPPRRDQDEGRQGPARPGPGGPSRVPPPRGTPPPPARHPGQEGDLDVGPAPAAT